MMLIQPTLERPKFFLNFFYRLCIFNGGLNLQPVADDAGILQQEPDFFISVPRYLFDRELVKGFIKIFFLIEDGSPGKPGLVDLQHQSCKQFIIVLNWKSIFFVMIQNMNITWIHLPDDFAVRGGFINRHKKTLETPGRIVEATGVEPVTL